MSEPENKPTPRFAASRLTKNWYDRLPPFLQSLSAGVVAIALILVGASVFTLAFNRESFPKVFPAAVIVVSFIAVFLIVIAAAEFARERRTEPKPRFAVFRLIKNWYDRLPSLLKLLSAWMGFLMGSAVVILIGMSVYTLAFDREGFPKIFPAAVVVVSFIAVFLIMIVATEFARERKAEPPTWQLLLAFMGGLTLPISLCVYFGLIPMEMEDNTVILLMICESLLFLVPLIVYFIRIVKPSAKPKPKWWQIALLVWGIIDIVMYVAYEIPRLMEGSAYTQSPARIALGVCLGVAKTLPYFLRR